MNRTNAIKFIISLVWCFGCLVSRAQTDTLYILYENSQLNNYGSHGRIIDHDSSANYPLDKGRRYEYSIRNGVYTEDISFVYMNKYPSWSDRNIEVITMKASSINELSIKDNEWFANTEKDEIVATFDNRNAVIFLGDKERIMDGKIYFTRVYFDYWAEE